MVSVKDSVTSGLLAYGSVEGMEAGGSSGCPVTPQLKFTWGYATEDASTEDGTHATKRRKREAVNGSNRDVGMEVKGLLGPC